MRRARPLSFPVLVLLAAFASGCFQATFRSGARIAVADGDPIVQLKKPGELPSLTKPRLVPPERRFDVPEPDATVLGLDLNGARRAYPIGLLDRYEVVNDDVSGVPLVVTRCALAGVAAAYDRRVGGRVLVFENSGALWRDTLVLQDRETGTYWSAATGRAVSGALEGASLARIPASLTRLNDWERAFPGSLYLDQWTGTSVPVRIQIYAISSWQGVSGATTNDRRYRAKEQVFVVAEGNEAFAASAAEIEDKGRIVADVGARKIQIRWDSRLRAPRAQFAEENSPATAIVPMYWFAVPRHYAIVRTPADCGVLCQM